MARDNKREKEIQAAVGEAISSWGVLEHTLGSIFRVAMGFPNHGPDWDLPERILALPNFQVQVRMIDIAVNHRYRAQIDILDEWKKIAKRLKRLKEKRDLLAHGAIGYSPKEDIFAVYPPFHSAQASKVMEKALRIEQIILLKRETKRLWFDATELSIKCETGKGSGLTLNQVE